jgi:succinylglutamic semialdehyde dehydrogenase
MKYELRGNYLNGAFILPPTSGISASENEIERYNPSNSDQLLWKMLVNYSAVDEIIDSAVNGYKKWRTSSLDERKSCLQRFQEIVLSRQAEIAEAIAMETGKPLWEAKTEAQSLASKINVTIEDSLPRIQKKTLVNTMPETDGHVIYKSLGPCLIIGPFNFPCHLANGQITSALIAGNSIIFKPSEKTAYSGQLLIECFHQAGFPEGVINLIQGDGEVARRLVKDRKIRGVYFTGSKEVGLNVLKSTYQDLGKLVALELGGKNASIIHKDANLELALSETLKGAFLTSGQRCTSTSIVAIHSSLINQFIERFHDISKKIIIDHPIEHNKTPFMGPLIDQKALDSYLTFVGMAKREGIQEVMRGKQLEKKYKGYYASPSIHLAEKFDPSSLFLSSEIFGPNCTFVPYQEIDEAIAIANSTEFGLAASVFTQDKSIYELALRDVEAGLLNCNRSTVGASAKLPFGGIKNSGNYRPAAVATIDSCVYQMASLEVKSPSIEDLSSIVGLDL